ncbi:MAG: cupin domain-containing protein [Acidobacteriota bacterium]|nr:cupin domain-containing protein [Acidobacteriota bacterium]
MEIQPRRPTGRGPAEYFAGDVLIDPVLQSTTSGLAVNEVRFSPGARTAWHAHGKGQTLVVTDGEGRVQTRGEGAVAIRAGDVVLTPADEWHWHGAAPDRYMAHLSITEGGIEWGDQVTDADYGAAG